VNAILGRKTTGSVAARFFFQRKKRTSEEARPFTGTVIANFSAAEAELPDSASSLMNS
jgi:hypothetical protein